MPYANEVIGIYRVINTVDGACYVGQSRRVKKRIADHMNLLERGIHPNPVLQDAYVRCGRDAFSWAIEVVCDGPEDLDTLEEAFLTGEASFSDAPKLYNISSTARRPMAGRAHSEATKQRISDKKRGNLQHVTDAYRQRLSESQSRRYLSNPEYVRKVRYILDNAHLTYAERARHLGADTGSVRRLALKFANQRELFR